MLIPSNELYQRANETSLSRRVNANSQPRCYDIGAHIKLIKKGEC